jgi:cold-inducible RNA-binding protein
MNCELYVGNLPGSATEEDLSTLFTKAGEVISVELIKDRKSGRSSGFAFITMSAQSEADKAVSMFNSFSMNEQALKVNMVKPRRNVTGLA